MTEVVLVENVVNGHVTRPAPWPQTTIGRVCKISTGRLDVNRASDDGRYPFFTCAERVYRIDEYAFDTEAVLVAGNGFFNVKYFKGKFNAYQRTYVLHGLSVYGKFLYNYILCRLRDITGGSRGSTIKYIRLGDLRDFPIVVPPAQVQRQIVAEIEKQFSRLDEAVANLKRAKANLKRYNATVLKGAVEGRLVPTEAELVRREGRSYETGALLLQRILETCRSEWKGKGKYKEPGAPNATGLPELPEGWVWSSYEQLGRLQLGRQRAPKYHSGPNIRPYLRVQNVFEDRLDLSDVMEMEFSLADFERYQLAPGDLLLNEGQSPELLGRPAIYRGELPGACFTNTLIRFRAFNGVSVEFALIVSRHHMRAGRFVSEGTITTNIAHLSLGRLATVEFPLPPLAEQQRIVAEVDRRLSLVRGVEAEVDANLKRAQALRNSVLQSKFGANNSGGK